MSEAHERRALRAAREAALVRKYGPPVRTEKVPCTTDQWNFPHPRNQPWVSDGACSICDQDVEFIRLGPERPNAYTSIAVPHVRVVQSFAVPSDELADALDEAHCCGDWVAEALA